MQQQDSIRASLTSFAGSLAFKGLIKSCLTGFGQKYALYGTQSGNQGNPRYELWMVTANARNKEVLSKPMKLTTEPKDQMQILALMDACEKHFASYPPPALSHPPKSCVIPANAELMSFSLIDLFNDTERLLPGDEVFVSNRLPDGRVWYHSGIYIGGGFFCHFVPKNGFNQVDFNSGKTVPGEVECVTTRRFYEAVPSESHQTFRVTHPILVREGLTIVEQAKRFMDEKVFNDYNYATRNCQHFSSQCGYDREFSYNTERLFSSNKPSQKVATVPPIVHSSSVLTGSCSIEKKKQESNFGNYVEEFYCGGPMAEVKHDNKKPSKIVSVYCTPFEMSDSEFF